VVIAKSIDVALVGVSASTAQPQPDRCAPQMEVVRGSTAQKSIDGTCIKAGRACRFCVSCSNDSEDGGSLAAMACVPATVAGHCAWRCYVCFVIRPSPL